MSMIRDGVIGFDHIVEGCKKIKKSSGQELAVMTVYQEGSKNLVEMHDQLQRFTDSSNQGTLKLKEYTTEVHDSLVHTLKFLNEFLGSFKHAFPNAADDPTVQSIHSSFRSAKIKLESAVKVGKPAKETDISLN